MVERIATIPRKVASFDQRGLDKVYNMALADPSFAQALATQLRQNPREAADQLFRLSPEQRSTLTNLSDGELSRISNMIADGLSTNPRQLAYSYSLMSTGGQDQPQALMYSFGVEFGPGGTKVNGSLNTGGGTPPKMGQTGPKPEEGKK